MEYNWTLFKNSTNSTSSISSNGVRGHIGNCTTTNGYAWDALGNINHHGGFVGDSTVEYRNYTSTVGGGDDHAPVPSPARDPHLTWLKLGKRPPMAELHVAVNRGRATPAPPPSARCQVEGCDSALANAKEYHRRHKVCEIHAKAPRVVVLGTEQRFCQQCSRFHAVGEFDESKRSCRRRLAGHNERRRKSSQEQHHSIAKKHSQEIKMMGTGTHQYFLMNSSECALSLLSSSSSSSSSNYYPWNIPTSSDDLPTRCSVALRELIAENRASVLACRQRSSSNIQAGYINSSNYKLGSIQAGPNPLGSGGGHVTLDLMQGPDSAFGLLSVHDHHKVSKQGREDDCSELWKVPLGY